MVPRTASDVPSHCRSVIAVFSTTFEKMMLVTNCDDSSGTRIDADAKAIATMLPIDPPTKAPKPMTHVLLRKGCSPSARPRIPIDC
eukprot:2009823-Prymnesium_polylepis.1